MTKLFTFQAIETRYHGYRFRSRLEARWAVFFDTLGIEYQYEPEGYSLEGIPYLPDFYLPQMDCFIEIKGQEPTQEELGKTRLLALYTGKDVYTFSGTICLPDERHEDCVYCYSSPILSKQPRDPQNGSSGEVIPASQDALLILQKLHEIGFSLTVTEVLGGGHRLLLKPRDYSFHVDQLEAFPRFLQTQDEVMQQVLPLLRQHEEDLTEILTVDDGWKTVFSAQSCNTYCQWQWCECSTCGKLELYPGHVTLLHHLCPQTNKGTMFADTPRLRAAHTAAREARF